MQKLGMPSQNALFRYDIEHNQKLMKYSARLETNHRFMLLLTIIFSEMAAASIVGWLTKSLYELLVASEGF